MTKIGKSISAAIMLIGAVSVASAGPIQDRIDAGETIRIGFANEIPWAYPGDGNEPLGFANVHALGVLKAMGYENIEPVVTEWGGLIPGLKAGRFDIITGGMYIIGSRCENISFSEPMGIFGDAFLVEAGNPKNIKSYADIKDSGSLMVTGAGYNTVEAAKKEGVDETRIMQVPGPTEILAAMRAGRADAGAATYFTLLGLAEQSGGKLEVTDPNELPDWTKNWVGIGFRSDDGDFLKAFNAAQADYLGSNAMLQAVAPFKYGKTQLPDPSVKTEWICANR
ncbi:transporter substrate-binding domain-containing protein [Roseibium sp.]|uniref:transporter substrate-binding domain-containing protein n=1 Tax=Roseibium sp. TaxID=1936156 RepID=UPI003BAC77E6